MRMVKSSRFGYRIAAIVALVWGGAILVRGFAGIGDSTNADYTAGQLVGMGFGVLLVVGGVRWWRKANRVATVATNEAAPVSADPTIAGQTIEPVGEPLRPVSRSKAPVFVVAALILVGLLPIPFLVWSIRAGHLYPTLERVAVAALVGGLIGGLGGAIGGLFNPKEVGKTAGGLSGLGLAMTVLLSGPLLKEISHFVNPEAEEYGEKLAALPEFRAWAAKTHGDVKSQMAQLTARGLRRLDDSTLVNRLDMMAAMVAEADVRRCAAVERGTASGADLLSLMHGLSKEQRSAYYDMVLRAATAEMRRLPRRRWLSKQRRDEFYGDLRNRMKKQPNGERALAVLENPGSAADRDLCEASRAVYRTALSMPEAPRNAAALILLTDDGAEHLLLEDSRWLSLDDDALVLRAEILSGLLQGSSEAECAAIARQAASDEQVDLMLEDRPSEVRTAWRDLSRELTSAKGPARAVTKDEYASLVLAMKRQLANRPFDSDAYDMPDGVSAAAACQAHRTFVAMILSLPKSLRPIGARVLVGGAPPSE
jgi:hypothetical protein